MLLYHPKTDSISVPYELISETEEWAKSKGIIMMRLNSGAAGKEAHTFYHSLGYDDQKNQLRFTKSL